MKRRNVLNPQRISTQILQEMKQTPLEHLDGSETVLIAEDEDSLRKLAQIVLKHRGYKVLEAENGEDALRISNEERVFRCSRILFIFKSLEVWKY